MLKVKLKTAFLECSKWSRESTVWFSHIWEFSDTRIPSVSCPQYKVKVKVMSDSLRPHRPYSPWNSPGQNTGLGNLSLLWVIFPTQGSNPGLPLCRQILYQLSHKGSPRYKVALLIWMNQPGVLMPLLKGTYIRAVNENILKICGFCFLWSRSSFACSLSMAGGRITLPCEILK